MLNITIGADVYPIPPFVILNPVTTPPVIIAVALAGVVLPATENEIVGADVNPLPPPIKFIALTEPPLIVAVAEAFGVFTIIESLPVLPPIVFPVTFISPDARYIPSQGLLLVLV